MDWYKIHEIDIHKYVKTVLPIYECLEREVYELKNSYNTMNSSSAESVINKLKRAHKLGIKARLVLINCNKSIPRFKSPEYIDVWDGNTFYTHITGSDTFFDRLLETFNTAEEILQSVSPLQ